MSVEPMAGIVAWSEICPGCGLDVRYRDPRRKCAKCGKWAHSTRTRVPTGCLPSDLCCSCSTGKLNLEPLRNMLLRDVELGEDLLDSGMVVMASALWCGPDEAKICELTGLDPAAVRERGDRLRESGIWHEGEVYAELGDDLAGAIVWVVLASLCAEGQIVRTKSDEACGILP